MTQKGMAGSKNLPGEGMNSAGWFVCGVGKINHAFGLLFL